MNLNWKNFKRYLVIPSIIGFFGFSSLFACAESSKTVNMDQEESQTEINSEGSQSSDLDVTEVEELIKELDIQNVKVNTVVAEETSSGTQW